MTTDCGAAIRALAEPLARIPGDDVRALCGGCAASAALGRGEGLAALADWYDALGALTAEEIARRAGEAPAGDAAGRLAAALGALDASDLGAILARLVSPPYGEPGAPAGDLRRAVWRLVRAEHRRRAPGWR